MKKKFKKFGLDPKQGLDTDPMFNETDLNHKTFS